MSRRYRDNWGGEFVPAVHYGLMGTSLCGTTRAKINGTLLTKHKTEVTCKNCIKKLAKGGYVEEHFHEDLFTL